MTSMAMDPSSGNMVYMQEHEVLVTFVNDTAFFGLMVLVYDWTGLNRLFLAVSDEMASNPAFVQALRYGMMFGSILELRRWLEGFGWHTDLSWYARRLWQSVP